MLRSINEIPRVQSKPKKDTEIKSTMLIYYMKAYSNIFIFYKDRNMVLHLDSDAAYFIMAETRICYAGNFILAIGLHRGQ